MNEKLAGEWDCWDIDITNLDTDLIQFCTDNGRLAPMFNTLRNGLEKLAASTLPAGWIRFDDNPPPDNENILLGKHHADDLDWYWIVQGSFEEGEFHLDITDDVFKLQTEDGWHKPTHWKRSQPHLVRLL